MSRERFDALMVRLAHQLELEDLPDLLHRGLLNVAGIDVLLGCGDDGDLRLVVDMGPLPDGGSVASLRRLLDLNLRRAEDAPLTLALHPQSGHVIGIALLAVEALEGEGDLLRLLTLRMPSWFDAVQRELDGLDDGPREAAPVGLDFAGGVAR